MQAGHTQITAGTQVKSASPPAQGMEINVGVPLFPRQINLDLASPGHAAERTEEVRTFTECQPHAPSGKTEPGQWRPSGREGERRALESSGKRNPNNLVHATGGAGRRSQTACKEEKGRQEPLRRKGSPARPEELGRSAGEPSRAGRGRSRRARARSEARG